MKNFLTLVCLLLSLAACTWSAPGTPNRSPGRGSPALDEIQSGLSSPADNEKRAIAVGPTFVPSPVRYIAIFYDWSGYFRILMPTLITSDLLNLFPFGVQPQSIPLSILSQFVGDPVMSRIPLWQLIGATATYANTLEGGLEQLQGAVVNLAIDFNIMPVIRYHNPYVRVATQEMEPILVNFIRDFLAPYWLGSPSSHLVALDPRQVSIDWLRVPDARSVAEATTYVFSYLTPVPGSPSKAVDRTYSKNLTMTGNSTQVATLKMTNSTGHLETNLTKRATITCQDFYPNILPFLKSGPMTPVGTDTISCAA